MRIDEAENETAPKNGGGLTLTEVAQRTGISLPTLQRYKRLHGARIPSKGEGRAQRYPVEAVDVFRRIKRENLERNSLPRPGGRLLSLTAQRRAAQQAAQQAARGAQPRIGQRREDEEPRTGGRVEGTSLPDGDRSTRNGGDTIARRISALEASQLRLEKEIRGLLRELSDPWTGTFTELLFEESG